MNNLERLDLTITEINLPVATKEVYLQEENLKPYDEYIPANKRAILKTSLSILEDIANSPSTMKEFKINGDISVSAFAENLEIRIRNLSYKIRSMKDANEVYEDGASTFNIFSR
ncbi:MAG: hypothetical protein PHY55_03865 [Bacteroidales bacterium]|nr:hypothetical protein [Bacteroidales bacterium]